MTDSKKPADPVTATAPLNRPMAEAVSLELVWAAAFAVARLVGGYSAAASAREANELVEELLVTHPRGAR